jgi:glucosyltransferase
MGIMGKYIAKTYLEVKNRPHYIVSETNKDHVDPIH